MIILSLHSLVDFFRRNIVKNENILEIKFPVIFYEKYREQSSQKKIWINFLDKFFSQSSPEQFPKKNSRKKILKKQ